MAMFQRLRESVAGVFLKKTAMRRIEEQNTHVVYYPRARGLPKRYVYGKRPDEPVITPDWHPEGVRPVGCASETDEQTIAEHLACCRSEPGNHGGLCEMCCKLNNPKRLDLMVRLYRDMHDLECGLNVNGAQDGSGLNQPATSEYLRQLSVLGLIRRERCGRVVGYYPDYSRASRCVGEIGCLIMKRLRNGSGDMSFAPIFRVMMGSLRSRIVRDIAAGGCGSAAELCDKYGQSFRDLERTLQPAIDGRILALDSQDRDGTYSYVTPADPIARRIVELS